MKRVSLCSLMLLMIGAATWGVGMQLAWRYPTGGRIRSQPVVGPDGSIYALSDDGFLYSFTPPGKTQWAVNLGGLVVDSLSAGTDGTVYAGLRNNRLVAVNPHGGVIWTFDTSSPILGNPATATDGTVFVGTSSGTLYSVSLTGLLEWKITLPARMTSAPVLDGQETVYLGGSDGRLYALTRWGRFRWSLPLNGEALSVAAAPDGDLYVRVSGGVLEKVSRGGEILWRRQVGQESFGPLLAGDRVLIARRDGEIFAYDASGRRVWKNTQKSTLTGAWAADENRLYIMEKGDEVVVVDVGDGSVVTRSKVGAVGGMTIAPPGMLLIGGEDWLVYAYSGVTVDATAPWGGRSGDNRNSGHGLGQVDPAVMRQALSRVPDFLALEAQENAASRYALDGLLREIEGRIAVGGLGKSTWYVSRMLERIVGVGILNPVVVGNSVVNDFPDVRARAASLLGKLGSLAGRSVLIRLLTEETDSVAAAAEIEALGRIGSDNDGSSTRTIVAAVNRFAAASQGANARVALASIHALAAISRYEGEIPDSGGRVLLLSLYRGPYPTDVREAALALLMKHGP